MCSTIAEAPQAHPVDALRITTAAAPPSPTVIAQLEAIGVTVVHVYGLTEVYGPYTICEYQESWSERTAEERASLLSRQGVGMVQAENARVVDAQMNDVPPADGETMGEIVLRGNNVMLGYYRNPEATAEASRAAGSTRAISASCTRTATSSSRTARRTSSSPAARTSQPSRWSRH